MLHLTAWNNYKRSVYPQGLEQETDDHGALAFLGGLDLALQQVAGMLMSDHKPEHILKVIACMKAGAWKEAQKRLVALKIQQSSDEQIPVRN